jgi:hypothetical protein
MISVKYDVAEALPRRSWTRYSEEIDILIDFDKSNHSNVCLEYDTLREARVVVTTLNRHIKGQNLNVQPSQRGNLVYLFHKEVK